MAVEDLDHAGEVGQGPCQPVDLVDNDDIDTVAGHVVQQALQASTVHRAARDTTIVIPLAHRLPTFAHLALDEGLAGLTLCIEAVEVLFEPFLAAFARIDGAADAGAGHVWVFRRPKKRGPFHRAPAMTVAAAERLA